MMGSSRDDEAKLVETLRRVEALFSGGSTDGERAAAGFARERIIERLAGLQREAPAIEYRFKVEDEWSRTVFLALLRRYGIRPYRYARQRRTTVMARVPQRFVDETLWPKYEKISEALRQHLTRVTDRVVQEVFDVDISETDVVGKSLPAAPAPSG